MFKTMIAVVLGFLADPFGRKALKALLEDQKTIAAYEAEQHQLLRQDLDAAGLSSALYRWYDDQRRAAEEDARQDDQYESEEEEEDWRQEEEAEEADRLELEWLSSEFATDDNWRYDHMGDKPL